MTDAGGSARAVWWPRLVLWGTVIAAGSLYLLSVERHRKDAPAQAPKPPAVLTVPAADTQGTAAPGPGSAMLLDPSGGVAGTAAPVPAGEAPSTHLSPRAGPVVAVPPPVAEPLTQPRTERVAPESGPAAAAGSLTQPSVPAVNGGAGGSVAAASVPETQAPPAAVSHAATVSDMTPVEARAFAGAVTEGHAAAVQALPAAGPVPGPGPEQKTGAPPARTQPTPDPERARILAQYEALRRAAEGDLQPPDGRVYSWPRGYRPDRWPSGYYAPAPYGAPGRGGGYGPANPRW